MASIFNIRSNDLDFKTYEQKLVECYQAGEARFRVAGKSLLAKLVVSFSFFTLSSDCLNSTHRKMFLTRG